LGIKALIRLINLDQEIVMKRERLYIFFILAIVIGFPTSVFARAESENYLITTSVQSSGGAFINSGNYKISSTIGQPSPLSVGQENPNSENYDNYPGFWCTVKYGPVVTCAGDLEPDGVPDRDVDGLDLYYYIFFTPEIGLDEFATNFGKTDCP